MANPKEVPIFVGEGFEKVDPFTEILQKALPSLTNETPDQPLWDDSGVGDWRDHISRIPSIDRLDLSPENTP